MTRAIPWSRAKLLILCTAAFVVIGAVALILTTGGGTAHAGSGQPVTLSDYSVLNSSAVGDASSALQSSSAITGTMTSIPVGKPNISVKIAKSTEGGVCVFVERSGAKDDGGSCIPSELLRTGTTAELHEGDGEIIIAGVVPDGVSSVIVQLSNKTSQTVPVVDNGWAIEDAPAGMANYSDTVGG